MDFTHIQYLTIFKAFLCDFTSFNSCSSNKKKRLSQTTSGLGSVLMWTYLALGHQLCLVTSKTLTSGNARGLICTNLLSAHLDTDSLIDLIYGNESYKLWSVTRFCKIYFNNPSGVHLLPSGLYYLSLYHYNIFPTVSFSPF